jgi:aminocarboxymuconate-semialdehyde decarboxylase
MPTIDIHTHQLHEDWIAAIREHGGRYSIGKLIGGQTGVSLDGSPFMTLTPPMLDIDLRIRDMNRAGVDIAVMSLTCPSVYWGGEEVSRALARRMNRHSVEAENTYPERLRWLATLPWQYPAASIEELAWADSAGAVGVFVAANLGATHLTDASLEPVWREIENRDLPVLVHPTCPQGMSAMDMRNYNLVASIGFMFDTTLAFTRMIFDGFLDRHPSLKLIAAHAGGTLPYLAGRLDICFENMPACREKIASPPSEYLRRIYYDAVTFTPQALDTCIAVGGSDRVLFGSDYPHNIGDMEGCLSRVEALPTGQSNAIRGENAKRIFTRL